MHPRSLVHVMELEGGVYDGKAISEQREQPEPIIIHVANTVLVNDALPHMVSAYLSINIAQQYGLIVSQDHSESGIQGVMIAIINIIRRV